MKILAVGDVCGTPGLDVLARLLHKAKTKTSADLVIVNGENASMRGISPQQADEIFNSGADVITLGNHSFANRQICNYIDDNKYIIRPYNLPSQQPGMGYVCLEIGNKTICVANLIGRLYMDFQQSSPFTAADELMNTVKADSYIFDFHAEATTEKLALGYYLDGRAAVVYGTHTHVQTADIRTLPKGTGYITDIGMTGGLCSVIGVKWEQSVDFFKGELGPKFQSSDQDLAVQGALFEIDNAGRCVSAVNHTFR